VRIPEVYLAKVNIGSQIAFVVDDRKDDGDYFEGVSARNRGKSRMERPSSRKPTLGMCGSASVRYISEQAGSIYSDALFPCPWDHLKFSISHTFFVGLTSRMANNRPSGDGIAYPMKVPERSSTEALPSSATFSNALSAP
jgi:hypothetical protein